MRQDATNRKSETIIIGLSGPSSSGKTTLARLLRQIFDCPGSSLFILHEDDFYKTDKLIPRKTFTSSQFGTRELDDWDCVDSLDLPLLKRVLSHIKLHGVTPDDFASKEDQNAVGDSGVSEHEVRQYAEEVKAWIRRASVVGGDDHKQVTICVVDGFLLFPDPDCKVGSGERELHDVLEPLLDLKLFLPSSREKTIDRRTKRTGYVTLEGFWEDPPGYVTDVVWPNYARDHAWLFGQTQGKDETLIRRAIDEGCVDRSTAEQRGVAVGPGCGDAHLKEILPWTIEMIKINMSKEIRRDIK